MSERSKFSRRPELVALESRWVPQATAYLQTNLVSDLSAVARNVDQNLTNAWGLALNPSSGAFWVSSNHSDVSTLYMGDVRGSAFQINSLVVQIPGGEPTGVVNNTTSDFQIGPGGPIAKFIFASEAGNIVAWSPSPTPTQAQIVASVSGGVFKGLAIGTNGSANFIYATDFHNGQIVVFDNAFHLTSATDGFTDPNLPAGFAPFGIQNINGQLYVSYAKQAPGGMDDMAGAGNGFVDVFSTDGTLVNRLISNGPLNSPWGMVIAPSNFGEFGGDLLVGNFGDGRINVFDPVTGTSLGPLKTGLGNPVTIDGLWGLAFGNGVTAGDRNALYFTAGPNQEAHGLFGSLRAITPITAVGAGAGGLPTVVVYGLNGVERMRFNAFDPSFRGGVTTATGDINNDGFLDIVVAAASRGGPHVKIFSGADGSLIREFFAYDARFLGGVNVGAADIDGDGFVDVITGAGAGGGPHVKVFSGADGHLLREFFAYDAAFRGGVNVAGGDIDGDGRAEIITGAGPGGGPHVKAFSGLDNSLLRSFFAYAANFTGGVSVAASDQTADGRMDIITGAGPGGGPHLEVFDGADLTLRKSFYAMASNFTGGIRVASADINGDGFSDLIAGSGPGGQPMLRIVNGEDNTDMLSFLAFDAGFHGGVFVG